MRDAPCVEDGCDARQVVARNLCRKHYVRWYRRRPNGTPCAADDCEWPAYSAGYCAKHRNRIKRHGSPDKVLRRIGLERVKLRTGYVNVRRPDHPQAVRGWVAEHRVVVEEILGRRLLPGENVHHINGIRDDNRPDNLELWVSSQPAGQRISDLTEWAVEILQRYAPDRLTQKNSA